MSPEQSPLKYGSAAECPQTTDAHVEGPSGYVQWHHWADRMGRTHKQRRCRDCGFYSVWEPKWADGEWSPKMTVPQLRAYAAQFDIDLGDARLKAGIIAALELVVPSDSVTSTPGDEPT